MSHRVLIAFALLLTLACEGQPGLVWARAGTVTVVVGGNTWAGGSNSVSFGLPAYSTGADSSWHHRQPLSGLPVWRQIRNYSAAVHRGAYVFPEEDTVRRTLILASLTTVMLNLASIGTDTTPLRPDTSHEALISLGQEYGDLQQWAEAIAEATDTLDSSDGERARTLARQLARVIDPLEHDFEKTTASLSTNQLEQVLPLWERMVFAHAGFLLLQEEAATLGSDPALDPAELHDVAAQLSAVLEFASEIQRRILEELTAPVSTSIRLL